MESPAAWREQAARRKLHLGVDEATGEIRVAEVTTNGYHDSEMLPSLLDSIDDEIVQVSGDGAYDTFAYHEAIAQRSAVATISRDTIPALSAPGGDPDPPERPNLAAH